MPYFWWLASSFWCKINKFPLSMLIYMLKGCQFWIPKFDSQQPNWPYSICSAFFGIILRDNDKVWNCKKIFNHKSIALDMTLYHSSNVGKLTAELTSTGTLFSRKQDDLFHLISHWKMLPFSQINHKIYQDSFPTFLSLEKKVLLWPL